MKKYNPKIIEAKWQKAWARKKLYEVKEGSKKPKAYLLAEFPYPSGDGLHVGHVRGYTAMDVVARKRRAEGFEVLYPMGWDAFGLPTENYAIKTGLAPEVITKKNTARYRKQMQALGFSFDWSREINTSDPNYYKWTQWLFLQFFKAGLAYKSKTLINWCPKDKIGLANEEAIDGVCERCGGKTEMREKEQWLLAITKYADRLDRDLDLVDYPESVKAQQRNWIGRTEEIGPDGKTKITYRLRDWIFSRQRYWGEPIPLIWCEKCNEWQAVPEKDLPVKLPKVKKYQPTDNGESPLADIKNWVNVKCPKCQGPAKRETDTMPSWAGSSWYYLRYLDPKNKKEFASSKKLKSWLPINWYNGGMEHTTLHLLYSRFWHKFLFDQGLVPTSEPYKKRTSHGLILASDGEKMSKSRGNVVNPDEIITRFGADTLRVYEMFMGPFDQAIGWNEDGLVGARRFIERAWRLVENSLKIKGVQKTKGVTLKGAQGLTLPAETSILINQTITKVSADIEAMKFNTAISSLMILLNKLEEQSNVSPKTAKIFLKLLSPFAPYVADELWQILGEKKSIHLAPWPKAEKNQNSKAKIIIQVNSKIKDVFEVALGLEEGDLKKLITDRPKIKPWLEGKTIKRIIFVPNRLINFLVDSE